MTAPTSHTARRWSLALVGLALAAGIALSLVAGDAYALAEASGESAELAEAKAAFWGAVLPWHPKLVHLPIALCILMPPVTFGLLALVRLGWMERRSVLVAAGLQVALTVASLAALYTGHQDAVAVEGYAADYAMQAHDTRAHQFVYVAVATTLCFGLLVLAERKRSLGRAAVAAVIAAVMLQGYAGFRVGDAGGRLVYVGGAADAHR